MNGFALFVRSRVNSKFGGSVVDVTGHFRIGASASQVSPLVAWVLFSDPPFNEDWISGKARSKVFDVPAQCVPKFDENRSEFLFVLVGGKKPRAEPAYLVFHTKHGATASEDTVAPE